MTPKIEIHSKIIGILDQYPAIKIINPISCEMNCFFLLFRSVNLLTMRCVAKAARFQTNTIWIYFSAASEASEATKVNFSLPRNEISSE